MKLLKISIGIIISSVFLYSSALADDELFTAEDQGAQINLNGDDNEVTFLIRFQDGKRLGDDPTTKEYINGEEIDGGFGTSDVGCIDCGPDYDEPTGYEAQLNLEDGVYTIETWGYGPTTYILGMGIMTKLDAKNYTIKGVADKGVVSKFEFQFDSLFSDKWAVKRVATPSSLKQDIELSGKVVWISNKGIINSLLKKVENIEKSISKDKTATAKNQLNAFINEVKAQDEKHIHKDAATMLVEDAEYMIGELEK